MEEGLCGFQDPIENRFMAQKNVKFNKFITQRYLGNVRHHKKTDPKNNKDRR